MAECAFQAGTETAGSVSCAQYLISSGECEAWALAPACHRPQCMVIVNERYAQEVTANKAKTPKVLYWTGMHNEQHYGHCNDIV